MHRGFRFKLYPTPSQAEILGQWVGVTRLIYNIALEQRRDFWRPYLAAEGRHISFPSQGRELTELRKAFDWIEAVPQTIESAALGDLDRAYREFFAGRADYPTPRKAGRNDGCRLRGKEAPIRQLNAHWAEVRLPKIGWVRLRASRQIVGDIRTVTLARRSGAWSISFTSDIGEAAAESALPAVGIDRGVANALTLSTGEHVSLPCMKALDRRRRKAQRVLARRKRGSRRHSKQKLAIARLSAKAARIRAHHLHVASTDISRRFGSVALEDLKIGNMTTSGPGKRGLNRSILHQGWGIFATMLEYKLEAAGGRLAYVPAAYTSQTCSACGVVDRRSRKSQAAFECVHCGHQDHADINAAIEIKRRSTAFVEGGGSWPSDEASTLAA